MSSAVILFWDRNWEGAYTQDPFSAASHPDYEAGVALCRSIRQSELYLQSKFAPEIFEIASDLRYGLLAAILETHTSEAACDIFTACLKFIVQYHVKSIRMVLAEHLTPTIVSPAHSKPVFVKELSKSWQLLQSMLEDLERQNNAVRRFSLFLKGLRCDIREELDEMSFLVDDVRTTVSHKRGRLDHQLNESLLTESRASLKVANLTIKESQGTKLCELEKSHTREKRT